jgi:DNA-binding transcriptional ArsR family regulator
MLKTIYDMLLCILLVDLGMDKATHAMAQRASEVATLLKALSHPSRLMIVCTLVQGEFSVGALEEKLSIHQPHLSQHLTSLRDADVVTTRRDGKQIFYSLAEERPAELIAALYAIYCKELA